MRIKDCTLGKVVQDHCYLGKKRIGHIVGLNLNLSRQIQADESAEVVPEVLWAGDKHPTLIHPTNIEPCTQ